VVKARRDRWVIHHPDRHISDSEADKKVHDEMFIEVTMAFETIKAFRKSQNKWSLK
jgi:DnaJ-class molecular chaperone